MTAFYLFQAQRSVLPRTFCEKHPRIESTVSYIQQAVWYSCRPTKFSAIKRHLTVIVPKTVNPTIVKKITRATHEG